MVKTPIRGGIKPATKTQAADATGCEKQLEQAEIRAAKAETRTEQARTRTESAETRTEQAETRTEQAKTRTEQAEVRTEQAETRTEQAVAALQRVVGKEIHLNPEFSTRILKQLPMRAIGDGKNPIEGLTERQREILKMIAEGQNTKQIAEDLKLSPKTVEYHRMKLMDRLNIHDVPGLVRLALQSGLLPPDRQITSQEPV
jgi:DNA-binding CsgD family transcriptional regulator